MSVRKVVRVNNWGSKDHSSGCFSPLENTVQRVENNQDALCSARSRHTLSHGAGRGLGRQEAGSVAAQPRLPERDSRGDAMERALTGRSSSRRRRAKERGSAAVTEERSSPREAAGGMGAGPALVALLLAGSVLSATLLAPGRRAEPGERPCGLGGDRAWACPGRPRGTGPERGAGSALGWAAVGASTREPGPAWLPRFSSRAPGLGAQSGFRVHQRKGWGGGEGILGVPSTPRFQGPATPFHKLLSKPAWLRD